MQDQTLWYILGPILVVVVTSLIGLFTWIISSIKDHKMHIQQIREDLKGLGRRTNEDKSKMTDIDKQVAILEEKIIELDRRTKASERLEGEANLLTYFIQDWIRSKKKNQP